MTEAEAAILGAIIGGGAAVIGSLVTALLAQRDTQRDRAQQALDWMTGDTQRRNVGIAAIEAAWIGKRVGRIELGGKRFRRLTTPVLSGTVVYLTRASKQGDAPHELYNLDRIMALLISNRDDDLRQSEAYRHVRDALKEKSDAIQNGKPDTGLCIPDDKLKAWQIDLDRERPRGRRWSR